MSELTPVVNLIIARINRALEQLIDLLLAHLLAQVRQDVLDLALADEPAAVLVEHLEAADVLFDIKGLAEAAGAVQDLGEGVEVDCTAVRLACGVEAAQPGRRAGITIGAERRTVGAHTALEVCDLGQCGVLSAGAQQVAQRAAVDAPVAALVEELEGFAVVGGGLVVVIHCVFCTVVAFVVFVCISGRA